MTNYCKNVTNAKHRRTKLRSPILFHPTLIIVHMPRIIVHKIYNISQLIHTFRLPTQLPLLRYFTPSCTFRITIRLRCYYLNSFRMTVRLRCYHLNSFRITVRLNYYHLNSFRITVRLRYHLNSFRITVRLRYHLNSFRILRLDQGFIIWIHFRGHRNNH